MMLSIRNESVVLCCVASPHLQAGLQSHVCFVARHHFHGTMRAKAAFDCFILRPTFTLRFIALESNYALFRSDKRCD